jgi:type I restriction enzyme R subunit
MAEIDTKSPEFNEEVVSKLPALQLLINMGFIYLTPDEALELRNKRVNQVILDAILIPWMRENNVIRFKNETLPFSENNILNAVQTLKNVLYDGLISYCRRHQEFYAKIYRLGSPGKQCISCNGRICN